LFKIRYNGIVQKPETEEQDMLSCYYTKDLLNLQGVNIIKIENFELDTYKCKGMHYSGCLIMNISSQSLFFYSSSVLNAVYPS